MDDITGQDVGYGNRSVIQTGTGHRTSPPDTLCCRRLLLCCCLYVRVRRGEKSAYSSTTPTNGARSGQSTRSIGQFQSYRKKGQNGLTSLTGNDTSIFWVNCILARYTECGMSFYSWTGHVCHHPAFFFLLLLLYRSTDGINQAGYRCLRRRNLDGQLIRNQGCH